MTYPHTTFSTNCGIPSISLSLEQKNLLSTVMSEGAFKNPLEGKLSESSVMVDALTSTLEAYTGEVDISGLTSVVESVKGEMDNFTKHTNRLSGTDLSMDGELFGFQGLQGIASSYNNIKETMKNPGDAIEDNYSQMFSSVLGAGQDMMENITSKLSSIDLSDIDNILPDDLANITSDLGGLASDLVGSINADNLQLSTALDAVTKFGLGMMVMGMGKDSCFGNTLLDNIATDAVKDGLNKL